MTDFDETLHPRDGKSGEFVAAPKPEGGPDVIGAPAHRTPDVTLRIRRQKWGRGDYLEEVGVDEFPGRTILDSVSVAQIERARDSRDTDWVYEIAVDSGLLDAHDGPFDVDIDDGFSDDLDDYLDFRRDHGLLEPVREAVPFTVAAQREFIGEKLADAYKGITISDILRDAGNPDALRERFRQAATTLNLATLDPRVINILDFEDNAAIQQVQMAALRDTELPAYVRIATDVAAHYADWLITRDQGLAASDAEAARLSATR